MNEKMKILWFTPIPPREAIIRANGKPSGTGYWIHELVDELAHSDLVDLSVAYIGGNDETAFALKGVSYYPIDNEFAVRSSRTSDAQIGKLLEAAKAIVSQVEPDVIHVHGTESPFGMLRCLGYTRTPTVVSIQGLMGPCAKWAWGDKNLWDMIKLQRLPDLIHRFQSLRIRHRYLKRSLRENVILREVDAVLGRSDWDRSYLWSLAPHQKYFHVDEIMRPDFYDAGWEIERAEPYTIFTSGRVDFPKGIHVLVAAVGLLQREYPAVKLKIAGQYNETAMTRAIEAQIEDLDLRQSIEFLGWIDAKRMRDEMSCSRVFAMASFIENGCNSLQEAMLQGMPCVASYTGGLCTTLDHGVTGLTFPSGDAVMLADRIRSIFESRELSLKLGQQAKLIAQERHSRRKICSDLMYAYRHVQNV